MTIQQFIEKAIVEGWRNDSPGVTPEQFLNALGGSKILLDPLSWKSVGKMEGWKCESCGGTGVQIDVACYACRATGDWPDAWKARMHRFLDHLIDGLTLEEALERATS